MIIERTEVIPAGVLPGGGVFTANTGIELPLGTTKITFWVTYQRGAAGGRPAFRIVYADALAGSPDIDIGQDIVIDNGAGLTITTPIGEFDFYMSEPVGPDPDTGIITYVIGCKDLYGMVRAIALNAREEGVPADPGFLLAAMTGYGP